MSPTGSDSNNGTSTSTPWQTVTHVNAQTFSAGDSILFQGGSTFSGTLLYCTWAGTAISPIVIGSYGTGRATLSNTGADAVYVYNAGGYTFENIILESDSTHNGLEFYCYGSGRLPAIRMYGVEATGSKWGVIIGAGLANDGYDGIITDQYGSTWCDFVGNVYAGLFIYGPAFVSGSPAYAHTGLALNRIHADSNLGNISDTSQWSGSGIVVSSVNGGLNTFLEAHGNGTANGCTTEGPVGIFVYACKDVVTQFSLAYSNRNGAGSSDGDGFDIDINNVGCRFEYCLSYDNDGSGYLCWGSSSESAWGSSEPNVVRYCIGWGNARDAYAASNFYGELTFGGNLAGALAYGNTFIAKDTSAGGTPSCVSIQSGTMAAIKLYNNLLLQTGTGPVVRSSATRAVSEVWFLGNGYWSTGTFSIKWNATSYASMAAWQSALGEETYSSSIFGLQEDPTLVAPATMPTATDPTDMTGLLGLKFQSSSQYINAGIDLASLFSLSVGSQDFFGNPLSTPVAIGAYVPPKLSGSSVIASTSQPAMEWHTLDSQFKRNTVITGWQSFIWTERYNTAGDFQIVIKSTYQNRQLLTDGTYIGKKGSTYVMKIDTVTDTVGDDGTRNLTITGSSLENLLDDRLAAVVTTTSTTDDSVPPITTTITTLTDWLATGTPGAVARDLFNRICVEGVLDSHDTIPGYTFGTLLPAGNLAEPSDIISLDAAPASVYSTLTQLCNTYSLGFRFVKNGDTGEIYFEVYVGNDRTSSQSILPAVIFDQNLNNLEDVTQLTSSATLKTVAYVYATNGYEIVYAPTADPAASGEDRRVMLIQSSNSLAAGSALTAALQQEGQIALAAQREVYAFDGKVPTPVPYVYGQDYGLGDLVEERDSDGFGALMLVTEHISSSDDTGDTEYPTLTVSTVITPGAWLNYGNGEAWSDVDPSVHWADL